jgi:DNA repair photolyase
MEPNSAPYTERINRLKFLKDKGCQTWVSIEPYPTPNIIDQDLSDILEKIKFVDRIIFGRLNYNTTVSSYKGSKDFFNRMSELVINFCAKNAINYHIKEGTVTDNPNEKKMDGETLVYHAKQPVAAAVKI